MNQELHLFILWEKARRVEARILEDLDRQADIEVVGKWEFAFSGPASKAFPAFYGWKSQVKELSRLKVRKSGGGRFLLVVVRNLNPHYGTRWAFGKQYYQANELMYDLKALYREWAGRKHRVHGTTDRGEFARDIFLLTGHSADEWEHGVPNDIRLNIPARAEWRLIVDTEGAQLGLAGCRVILENKYINDVFFEGTFRNSPAVVKCSSTCAWSIGNEFRLASRIYAAAPSVVPEPLAVWTSDDGRLAFVVTRKAPGPTLTELLARDVTDAQADGFAADIGRLADALKETGIVHRDLFADNLIMGDDGHLKAIDWQLAVDRNDYREDPWVERHWKFRYVVFGVNRELGLGTWNDFHALGKILAQLPQTAAVRDVAARLAAEAPSQSISAPPDALTRMKLRLYALSLRVQMLLRGKRHRKYAQLERRWRTIAGWERTTENEK